jgi:hypothetical protein
LFPHLKHQNIIKIAINAFRAPSDGCFHQCLMSISSQ